MSVDCSSNPLCKRYEDMTPHALGGPHFRGPTCATHASRRRGEANETRRDERHRCVRAGLALAPANGCLTGLTVCVCVCAATVVVMWCDVMKGLGGDGQEKEEMKN